MSRRSREALRSRAILVLALLITPALSAAAKPANTVTLGLHVQKHNTRRIECALADSLGRSIPCSDFRNDWPTGVGADVYLVAISPDSTALTSVPCNINYNRACMGVFDFATCGQHGEFGAGSHIGYNRIIWDRETICHESHTKAQQVMGVFYVYAYAPDVFKVSPATVDSVRYAVTCSGDSLSLASGGSAIGFGSRLGVNPCDEN